MADCYELGWRVQGHYWLFTISILSLLLGGLFYHGYACMFWVINSHTSLGPVEGSSVSCILLQFNNKNTGSIIQFIVVCFLIVFFFIFYLVCFFWVILGRCISLHNSPQHWFTCFFFSLRWCSRYLSRLCNWWNWDGRRMLQYSHVLGLAKIGALDLLLIFGVWMSVSLELVSSILVRLIKLAFSIVDVIVLASLWIF